MKVLLLNCSSNSFSCDVVNDIITETLKELGLEVLKYDLTNLNIPFFDGSDCQIVSQITADIKESVGVIFSSGVTIYNYGSGFHLFSEYLSLEKYREIFHGKNCMISLLAYDGGANDASHYYSNFLQHFEGFDCIRILLNKNHLLNSEIHEGAKEFIEKQTEDFYRIVRQNRKFILPNVKHNDFDFLDSSFVSSKKPVAKSKESIDNILKNLDLDKFDEEQSEEIDEIAQLFKKKYEQKEEESKNKKANVPSVDEILNVEFENEKVNSTPRVKTIKQMTLSLPHYFLPQFSNGIDETIQLYISGDNSITGYLQIQNAECTYNDGEAQNADITIITDINVWGNILKGKITAQKAFMVGQLKVRGNFVLLTKFEQIFGKQHG